MQKDGERVPDMVTYLSKFIPSMSQHTEPSHGPTRDNVARSWVDQHQCAFSKLRTMLTEAAYLDTTM